MGTDGTGGVGRARLRTGRTRPLGAAPAVAGLPLGEMLCLPHLDVAWASQNERATGSARARWLVMEDSEELVPR